MPRPERNRDFRAFTLGLALPLLTDSTMAALPDLAQSTPEPFNSLVSVCHSPRFTGTLKLDVRNQGAVATPPSEALVFEDVDGDRLLTAGDLVHASVPLPVLSPCVHTSLDLALDAPISFRSSPLRVLLDERGLIAEIDTGNNSAGTHDACHETGAIDWAPRVKWQYVPPMPCSEVSGRTPMARSTPIVAQTTDDNGDGRIDRDDDTDIIFLEESSIFTRFHFIRILDGRTGTLINTIDPATVGARVDVTTPAVADLDGDGVPEIVVQGPDAMGVGSTFAFRLDGTLAWVTPSPTSGSGWVVISDLEADGYAEVVGYRTVLEHDGTPRWTSTLIGAANSDYIPIVADVDADGLKEVLAGAVAYRADGAILWQHRDPSQPAFVAPEFPVTAAMTVIELPGMAIPLIALSVPNGTGQDLYFMNGSTGALTRGPVSLPLAYRTGAIAAADVDGDDMTELIIASTTAASPSTWEGTLLAIDINASVRWTRRIDGWSDSTVTIFDFDGDGAQEVIVRADDFVHILDGRTGLDRASAPSRHRTEGEFTVVADLDHDGRAELVVPIGDDRLGRFQCGMIAYSNATWWGARSTWPDSDYHINDANDDGCVPAEEALSWCDHDTWRAQKAIPPPLADVTVSRLGAALASCPDVLLEARVGSAGMKPIPAGAIVTFYDGDPGAGGTPLASASTSRELRPGTFEDVSVVVLAPAGIGALYAEVVTAAPECDIDNLCGPASIPACGTVCTANAAAAPASHCAGSPATLDGTGSSATGCASAPELRFRQGAIVLRDWAPDLTFNWLLPSPGAFEVDVRCPTDRSCTATASSTLVALPDPLPPLQGNVLRAVRRGSDVELTFPSTTASAWRVYRDGDKIFAAALPLVPDAIAAAFTDPAAVPQPPDRFFYRVSGLSPCTLTPGP